MTDIEAEATKQAGTGIGKGNTLGESETAKKGQKTGKKDYTGYYRECHERLSAPEAADFLREWNIKTAADRLDLGYDEFAEPGSHPGNSAPTAHNARPCIIIPINPTLYYALPIDQRNDGSLDLEAPFFDAVPSLYNESALIGDATNIFLVKTPLDAIAVEASGGTAIALDQLATDEFVEVLEKYSVIDKTILLNLEDTEQERELRRVLEAAGIAHIATKLSGCYADPCDRRRQDPRGLVNAVREALALATPRPYSMDLYMTNCFDDDVSAFHSTCTGFTVLDQKLGGGLFDGGLYILTAPPGLGKTSLALQIGDQVGQAGGHVLFYSLEQSRFELASKSLARMRALQGDRSKAPTSLDIRKGDVEKGEADKITKAREEYCKFNDRISIIEANFDCDVRYIQQATARYMDRNHVRPLIIVDYLQIIAPNTDKSGHTQKEMVDLIVTELKRTARDLGTPILAICSTNRISYNKPISLESPKESGGIEFSADCVIGLQLTIMNQDDFKGGTDEKKLKMINDARAKNPRELELVILKNRYGIGYDTMRLDYYPAHDLFVERKYKDINKDERPRD